MKRYAAVLALATVAHAQQLSAPEPIVIKVTVCNPYVESEECRHRLAQWNRAKDIATMMPLLTQEFKNIGSGLIDLRLRNHIAVIAERIAKNRYE